MRMELADYRALKARSKEAKMPISMYLRRLIDRDALALRARLDSDRGDRVESALPR